MTRDFCTRQRSFRDALKQFVKLQVTTPLANILYRLEEISALYSFFSHEQMQVAWVEMFSNSDVFCLNQNEMKIPLGPGSFKNCSQAFELSIPIQPDIYR